MNTYSATIPAGDSSTLVGLTPIVPYWGSQDAPLTIVAGVGADQSTDPVHVAYGAPDSATKPAATQPKMVDE